MIRRLRAWLTLSRQRPESLDDGVLQDGVVQPDQGPRASPADIVLRYLANVPDRQEQPSATREPMRSSGVPHGVEVEPRRWDVRDLERLTRENAGNDVDQDENRQFLLVYLREFADSDGVLPIDFDGLVRDTFGGLIGDR